MNMNTRATTVDEYLVDLPDWQKANLVKFRKLVHESAPNVTEEIKWNVPTFSIDGKMIFAMSSFKAHTKFNFILNGALLYDEKKLFNNGLESKKSRSIDLKDGETIDEADLKKLLVEAISLSASA